MSTEGWIFMVGFRIFDVGLLILWMIWFFRLRNDEDDFPDDDGPGGGGPDRGPGPLPGGGGGLRGKLDPGPRRRDHAPRRPKPVRRGGAPPVPEPLPARVRKPVTPAPARRTVG